MRLAVCFSLLLSCQTLETPKQASSVGQDSNSTNVLVVYSPDGYGQVAQLARAISDGATAASGTVKTSMVQEANYKRDVAGWANAVVLGSPVINGNADPDMLSFINSFDFEDNLLFRVGGVFATGGSEAAGLEGTLEGMARGLRTFGMVTVGGTSWRNAHGTGILTNGSEPLTDAQLVLARDHGMRIAAFASMLKSSTPSPSPGPVISDPPSWGQTWRATVSANVTQVGYDAGLVIVNFTGDCPTPSSQRMLTIYGDFDTVLTRCDMGYEFIIDPPSRGGGCHTRVIGRDVDRRICEACSCPFCVRDTNGSFAHGEQHASKTVWESRDEMSIMGIDVKVWQGRATSAQENYALHTSIAYLADDPSVPVFVNVTHPLWQSTAARIDNFSHNISDSAFAIPPSCFGSHLPAVRMV